MPFAYLSLIKPSVLNGAVWFVERLKRVGHVPVPQSGLLLIGDAEQLPHLILYHVCSEHNKRHSFSLTPVRAAVGVPEPVRGVWRRQEFIRGKSYTSMIN